MLHRKVFHILKSDSSEPKPKDESPKQMDAAEVAEAKALLGLMDKLVHEALTLEGEMNKGVFRIN